LTDQIVKLYDAAYPSEAPTTGGAAAPSAPRSSAPAATKPPAKPKP